MAVLFRIGGGEKLQEVAEHPFLDEVVDLEAFVKRNPEVLGEGVKILKEQVDTVVAGTIDLLGVDESSGRGQLMIVELKKERADLGVLLQVLRYAGWAKASPDSIRLLLEQAKIKASDIDLTPRIVIVAPVIADELIELSQYIEAFEFDFIELKRFRQGDDIFILVEHKSPKAPSPVVVRAQEEWDWDKYQSQLGISAERIKIGQSIFNQLVRISQDQGWPLVPVFRQEYVPFKLGWRNVMAIDYWREKQFCYLAFNLGQPPVELGLDEPFPELKHHYDSAYHVYYVRVESPEFDISPYIPFMEAAYRYVSKS